MEIAIKIKFCSVLHHKGQGRTSALQIDTK